MGFLKFFLVKFFLIFLGIFKNHKPFFLIYFFCFFFRNFFFKEISKRFLKKYRKKMNYFLESKQVKNSLNENSAIDLLFNYPIGYNALNIISTKFLHKIVR